MNELCERIVDPRLVRKLGKLEEQRQARGGLLTITDLLMAFTVPASPNVSAAEDASENGQEHGRVPLVTLWMDGTD
jgi:hypothetical protein